MKIEKDIVASLSYELTVDGQIVDKASEENPLEYIHGSHMLIPRFEEEVEGKEPGDEFAFTLSPEEGYGLHNPALRFDIPKESFSIDGMIREDLLVVGRVIPMLNSAGDVCQAQIIEVKDNDVTVDFNHPMAGKTLNFTGKVVSLREATLDELKFGLHGEFLPHDECGCGCGHEHGHDCGCGHDHGHDCGCGHDHGCCHHEDN